jgi:glycosyltransferase involved in cell wall biosynthesis
MVRVFIDGIIYQMQAHGGISRIFNETLPIIAETQYDIEFLLRLPLGLKAVPESLMSTERIRVLHDVDLRPRRFFQRYNGRVNYRRWLKFDPQIFHTTYYSGCPFPRAKTIVTVYDFIDEHTFDGMSANWKGFSDHQRQSINSADAVIAISESTKADVLKFTDAQEHNVTAIPLSVGRSFTCAPPVQPGEIEDFRTRHQIHLPYWLYVGTRRVYKNFDRLLRAWALLMSHYKIETELVVIGSYLGPDAYGIDAYQAEFLIQNRLENRIKLLSGISDAELRTAYAAAQAFVFPSLSEGFGIPQLEAMACGTALILSDIPVFHEVSADAALYFDPHDHEELAYIMWRMMNPSVRQDIISKGAQRLSLFSWENSAQKMVGVYRHLVS